jgi:hypothetical protein
MTEPIFLDWDESLAAVKFKGRWRFFHDVDSMFLLDYSPYDSDYAPKQPGDFRYGTLVVDENNAEQWMDSLAGEIAAEQIPNTFLKGTAHRAKLTFVIDFDQKMWVGSMWHNDQSALDDYQPEDWTAGEDDVYNYVPPEIRQLWD